MGQKLVRPDEYKKAAILLAVRCGTVSRVDACKTYMLSNDEFSLWELAFNDEGIVGLRDRRLSARRRTRQSPSQTEGVEAQGYMHRPPCRPGAGIPSLDRPLHHRRRAAPIAF